MARVDQGVYKRYLDKFSKLEEEYEATIAEAYKHIGDEEMFSGDRVTAWWFLDNADEIYKKMGKLKTKIEDMLETQKFEIDNNKRKYEEKADALESYRSDLESRAKEIADLLGDDLSDIERETMKSYEVI